MKRREKRAYDVTIEQSGYGIDTTWSWEVVSDGEVIGSGGNAYRCFAVQDVKRLIRKHAAGKVDTAGHRFTIYR